MKGLLPVSLISIILLAGCTQSYKAPEEQKPLAAAQEAGVITGTTVEVTQTNETSGVKTYQVHIGEGVGIKEGPG